MPRMSHIPNRYWDIVYINYPRPGHWVIMPRDPKDPMGDRLWRRLNPSLDGTEDSPRGYRRRADALQHVPR